MKKQLSLFSLSMLIIAAICSIRNLPSAALFGTPLIFFFLLAAVLFLFPTALISAQFTASYDDKGGIYHWVKIAFGEKFAMVAIWLQWINTMIWYPTILSAISGAIAYMIQPELAQNNFYLAALSISIFWLMTLASFKGIYFSANLSSSFAILGTILPMGLLIFMGGYWLITDKPSMISFSMDHWFPTFKSMNSFVSLTAIMASFLGMELAGVHIADVKNPQKNFPKVLLFAASFILVTMLLGSLAIAVVLPEKEISLVTGVIQVFKKIFEEFNIQHGLAVIVVCIVFGSIGGLINWLVSPAKGLLQAAEYGYLPKILMKKNSSDVPINIMMLQALIVTVNCCIFPLVQNANTVYWFLTTLSTNLYMIMYVLLFIGAWKLNSKHAFKDANFRISNSSKGVYIVSSLGLLGCFLTLVVGFFPPLELHLSKPIYYSLGMVFAMFSMIAISKLFFLYKQKKGPFFY